MKTLVITHSLLSLALISFGAYTAWLFSPYALAAWCTIIALIASTHHAMEARTRRAIDYAIKAMHAAIKARKAQERQP